MAKRLQRSRTERMIGGVCGGLGEYFNIDPTIVRVLWVVVTLVGGAAILAYLILWVIVPLEPPAPAAPRRGDP
ncbi:MAG: PspC domain-containing protein [Actinomycetia bacterium]|nr:PspC domain-containing protein [Actinomycetes bacterium]